MQQRAMQACCAAALLFCTLLAGCGGESEPQQVVMNFTDEDLDAAWSSAWKEVNTVEAIDDKVAVMKGFLAKYTESHRSDNAANIIFYYQGEKLGDFPGAIAYVREMRAGLNDPKVAFDVDMELVKAYAKAGDSVALAELAGSVRDSEFLNFVASQDVIRAALEVEEWDTALAYAKDSERFCTSESVLKENENWEPSPEQLSAVVNNRIGRRHLYQGWAEAKTGKTGSALEHFAEADKYVVRFYVGIPRYDLHTIWGLTLLETGSFDEAIEKLAPAALIMGDAKAMEGLRKAYAGKHGGLEGFEEFLRAEHPKHARTIDDFELPDFDGQRHTFAELKGEVTIISVWNPGCGGCLEELPHLEDLWRKYKDQGLSVVALETSMEREEALSIIADKGLTFHLLVNEEDKGNDVVFGTLKVSGLPTSFIVDRDGRIMHFHFGFEEGDEKRIEEEILHLLES